jgi:hypothetical protein
VAFLTLLGFLTTPPYRVLERALYARVLLWFSAAASGVASVRFVTTEAVQGIVEAGTRATGASVVSMLREIYFAEGRMLEHGFADHDANGKGAAARLGELTGGPVRGGSPLSPAILHPRFVPQVSTASGPAAQVGGYLYLVCVPKQPTGWTGEPADAVDERRAGREFVAYAWPAKAEFNVQESYAIDHDERVLVSTNRGRRAGLRLVGGQHAPPCGDAFDSDSPANYRPWRGKKPRSEAGE